MPKNSRIVYNVYKTPVVPNPGFGLNLLVIIMYNDV